jgi:hypothetical protein
MAVINREALPRFKPPKHNFTTFRARSINAFAKASTDGILRKLAAAQGMQLEEGLDTLEQAYPVPIPSGGLQKAQNPRVFERMNERVIRGGTLPWQGGMSEELKKITRPGPVTNLYKAPNKAEKWGAAGAALLDNLIVERLRGGTAGTHGYDDAAFFGTDKKINPDNPNSPTYTNNFVVSVAKVEIVKFVRDVRVQMKAVKHPMATTASPMWMDQDLAAFMVSSNNFEMFNDAASNGDEVIVLKNGSDIAAATTIANREKGRFVVIESRTLPDDEVFSFAAGLGAEPAIMVHSLTGMEELPGGDFMASQEWFAETGTWAMPRIWELGANSEYATLNGQVLIGVDLDVDCILYAPWSVHRYKITWT